MIIGASIIEGQGRIGFGIVTSTFANSIKYDVSISSGESERVYHYEEEFSDFFVTVLATFRPDQTGSRPVIGGIGPQVHFLKATKYYITDGYSISARDFRLGIALWLRFHQRIDAFGNTAIVITASHCWAQRAGDNIDPLEYTVPEEALAFPTITAGLAFPF